MNQHANKTSAKLVFVNRFFHPDESATSQMLTDLAVSLAERGLAVHVICSRQLYDQPRADLAPHSTFEGVTIHRLRTTHFGRTRLIGRSADYASFYWYCAWELIRLLERGDTVVAKTDPPLLSILAALVASLKGARLINWLQDVFPEIASRLGANPLPRPLDALLRKLRDWSLRRAHANVVIGARMADLLRGFGIPSERVRVIENWADSRSSDPPAPQESRIRAQLKISGAFVVGYCGNLGRAHEYQTVLDAAELLKDDPGFVFLFVGGGAGMNALRSVVEAREFPNFRFLPYVARESLTDSLAAPDVHLVSLLPMLEGLIVPSKFYGILSAGRPVVFVGANDGELARIIRTFDVGVSVPVGDAGELARQLRTLRRDAERCRAMSSNARRLYLTRYSPERAVRAWIDMLR